MDYRCGENLRQKCLYKNLIHLLYENLGRGRDLKIW